MSFLDSTELLCQILRQTDERHQLFPSTPGDATRRVLVAVSGGADSVCLLHLLLRFASRWNLTLHVAHLDHNLRPDSAVDATFVQKLAAQWGLPFHTRRLSQAEIGAADNNLEAGLRRLRYDFLANVADSLADSPWDVPTVAVAHNADDQAETILMHVLRGSGLAGLVGMQPVSFLTGRAGGNGQVRIVRPLLDVQRTHILQYLNAHGLEWREDPSNRDLTFTRNRLRHQIIPQLAQVYPNLTGALSRLGTLLSAENERAERLNEEAFHTILLDFTPHQTGSSLRAVMDRGAFRELDLATQRGVLRHTVAAMGVPLDEMTYERTESLRTALVSHRPQGPTPLVGGIAWSAESERFSLHEKAALAFPAKQPYLDDRWRATFGAESLPIDGYIQVGEWRLTCREIKRADLPTDWMKNSDPWQMYCNAWHIGELLLTTPRRGQEFMPLGMGGQHKNLGDFFTDNKIPLALRAGWPLLVDGASGETLWICGLRLSHSARILPETEDILHLKWSKK